MAFRSRSFRIDNRLGKYFINGTDQTATTSSLESSVSALEGKEYASFYDNAGGQNLNSGATINLDTTFKNSNGSVFSLSSDIVTVNKTGTFLITYDMTTDVSSGSGRTCSYAELRRNNTYVDGTRGWMYNRISGRGENTCTATIILDVTSGQNFRIFATRSAGTDTIISEVDGTRLTFVEL